MRPTNGKKRSENCKPCSNFSEIIYKYSTLYCDTPQVNQLTALLIAHGIHHVVVCPGSRNATIVHNLHAAGNQFALHPVTDERSAAFVALGLTLATQQTVAVCVTSGSALLGCIPAVAEAYYRHLPLLVISADRPAPWIGQLDGQTLPQTGALQPYCPTHTLLIPHTDEDLWYNNREVNAALLSTADNGGQPAHLNVPIAEPMFSFTTPELPSERIITKIRPATARPLPGELVETIARAKLPALIMGQYEGGDVRAEVDALSRRNQLLVLPELLSDVAGSGRMNVIDANCSPAFAPDLILHAGGNFVHKRFKQWLRKTDCRVIRIGHDTLPDTFCHLNCQVEAPLQAVLAQLADELPQQHEAVCRVSQQLDREAARLRKQSLTQCLAAPRLTLQGAVAHLADALSNRPHDYSLHVGNSSAVRAVQQVMESGEVPVFCNRGVNGIEGSLSAAVGYALGMWGLHIVVIGDLSFFYDANALWNTELPSGLRILLLNNGHGAIFDHLPGLSASPARDNYIAAGGKVYSAEGVAQTFGIAYQAARTPQDLRSALQDWWDETKDSARLIEVFLDD